MSVYVPTLFAIKIIQKEVTMTALRNKQSCLSSFEKLQYVYCYTAEDIKVILEKHAKLSCTKEKPR